MLNPANKQVAEAIVRLYHPDKKIKTNRVSCLYDWIIITAPGISIGVEFNIPLSGQGWTIEKFQWVRDNASFRAWRFYDDFKVNTDNPSISEIMSTFNVPKPTVKEMYKNYYKE